MAIPSLAYFFRGVHHNRDRKAVILTRVLDQPLPVFRANVGRIDDLAASSTLLGCDIETSRYYGRIKRPSLEGTPNTGK